jgi:hypothetical protein
MTLSITISCHNAECRYAECRIFFIVMLTVVMLSVVMLSTVAPIQRKSMKMLSKISALCHFLLYKSFKAQDMSIYNNNIVLKMFGIGLKE